MRIEFFLRALHVSNVGIIPGFRWLDAGSNLPWNEDSPNDTLCPPRCGGKLFFKSIISERSGSATRAERFPSSLPSDWKVVNRDATLSSNFIATILTAGLIYIS